MPPILCTVIEKKSEHFNWINSQEKKFNLSIVELLIFVSTKGDQNYYDSITLTLFFSLFIIYLQLFVHTRIDFLFNNNYNNNNNGIIVNDK